MGLVGYIVIVAFNRLIYSPDPWTYPTYHPKLHPYLMSRFATMFWTDRQTHRPTDGWRE